LTAATITVVSRVAFLSLPLGLRWQPFDCDLVRDWRRKAYPDGCLVQALVNVQDGFVSWTSHTKVGDDGFPSASRRALFGELSNVTSGKLMTRPGWENRVVPGFHDPLADVGVVPRA